MKKVLLLRSREPVSVAMRRVLMRQTKMGMSRKFEVRVEWE
jgi:hypothetical protein